MIEQAIAPTDEDHHHPLQKRETIEKDEELIDILAIETDELTPVEGNGGTGPELVLRVAEDEKINPFAPKEMFEQGGDSGGAEGPKKAGFTKVALRRSVGAEG